MTIFILILAQTYFIYYTRRLQFAEIITHIDLRIFLSRLEIYSYSSSKSHSTILVNKRLLVCLFERYNNLIYLLPEFIFFVY